MFRKKRLPAPHFKIAGSPFNPATGKRAPLGRDSRPGTTLAIFQVVADDTHDNYVECRGYEAESDPTFKFLHDPYTHPDTTPISVAKPYGVRGTFPYVVGQMIVAARIKTILGDNQGVGTTVGHPADLDEEIAVLLDDNSVSVAWIDVGASGATETRVRIRNDFAGTLPAYGVLEVAAPVLVDDLQVYPVTRPTATFKRMYLVNSDEDVADDAYGWATWLLEADWVLYDDASLPAIGESWGPQDGSFELKKNRYGFTIWGNPSGGATDLVQAQQMWVNDFYGQTDAAIAKGASGTVSVYDGANADTSVNVASVENKYANVAISKKVTCQWQAGVWRLIAAEC